MPVIIKVQELQRLLIADRAEVLAIQSRHQRDRNQLIAQHRSERDGVPSDQLQSIDAQQQDAEEQLAREHHVELQDALQRSRFATSWNFVDAYLNIVFGPTSSTYAMLRQALVARRVLLLLDGVDEGGVARGELERHVSEVLAPQGHTIVLTARTEGLQVERFREHFEWLTLRPLTDVQQRQLVSLRLPDDGRADALLAYMRSTAPQDEESGVRETSNPLVLSMIIEVFGSGRAVPGSITSLYKTAIEIMLARVDKRVRSGTSSTVSVPYLSELLEAVFFRSHAAKYLTIEAHDVEAAALELGAPEQLAAIDWPHYKGRVRVGHVVKLLRGEHAGQLAVLNVDSRGKLINGGKEPRNPFKVTFCGTTLSGWVREKDVLSSGLDTSTFESRLGGDGRRKAMHGAFEKLPSALQDGARALRTWVVQGQLPLLTLQQAEPFQMQASHLSFQEFCCAKAICKGIALPGEPPWRWSAWWANTLRLGAELGPQFGRGLVRAAGASTALDLVGQIGGHRPTSLAAVAQLMLGVTSIDLSENGITPSELRALAQAIEASETLTSLSLSKNAIGDEGVIALSSVLARSRLTTLNLFGTGIKEEGAKALTGAISAASALSHLNLQYNAVRGESKKSLEAANAARDTPMFLVI